MTKMGKGLKGIKSYVLSMREMENKRGLSVIILLVFVAMLVSFVSAASDFEYQKGKSNESIQAAGLIDKAVSCFGEMQSRGIGLNRANESLQEALQLYSAQVALEMRGGKGDYKIINEDSTEVCGIKDNAFKAQDEMAVFNESYTKAASQVNLSTMDKEYNDVIKSFNEERFEDTESLIDIAYTKLSDVQASQTTLKLFYETTTRTIKDFFKENWKGLSIGTAVFLILLAIFWRTLRRTLIKKRLEHLSLRKESISQLIKNMQRDYFKSKKMSETEFNVKMNTFKEMIRSIDSQIPELKEQLAKIEMKNRAEKKGRKDI